MATKQTTTKCICHRLLIEAPAETVYKALTTREGLAGWWTHKTTGQFAVRDTIRFTFEPDYFKEMKIEVLQRYSRVAWRCLKGYEDWIGTTLDFELEPHANGTVLFFRHDGWAGYTPGFASCSYDWALFFRSLKFLCETGKGFPYPDYQR